ncbi:hypothetical protein TSOC111612_24370 [Tsukamurella ocularis]
MRGEGRAEQVRRGGIQPDDARVAPEPRPLPPHVTAGSDEGQLAGLLEVVLAVERGEDLGVADRAGRRDALPQAALLEGPDLVDQAGVEHAPGPQVDAGVEFLGVAIQRDDSGVPARGADLGRRRGEGLAGDGDDLEGADDPSPVGREDLRGGGGIERGELAVQGERPDLGEAVLEPAPHGGIGRGKGPLVEQRLEVHHRAADDDRRAARGEQGLGVRTGPLLVPRHGGGLGHVQHVELVVRNAAPLRDRELRGADVHAPVHLHRVDVDDLAVQPLGEVQGKVRLAGGGGSDDGDRPDGVADAPGPRRHPAPPVATR